MSVRSTSKAAYLTHRETGRAATQAAKIMVLIRERKDISLSEIQNNYEKKYRTRIEKSSVSGRVNELKALGLLEEAAPRHCKITKRSVNPVQIAAEG